MATDLNALPRTREVLERGLESGVHLGAQIYVSLRGKPVTDSGMGESTPGAAMTAETINLWFSATKPITAVTIAILCERGSLGLDDLVAKHIPEFAANGKAAITIRHLLTHTGGFRHSSRDWLRASWDEQIAAICAMPLEDGWVPGEKAGYHAETAFHLLGELVRRLDGRPFERFVREEIFLPLGMGDSYVGMTEEEYSRIEDRLGAMYKAANGELTRVLWDDRKMIMACYPAGAGRGPVRELGRFYEALLNGGEHDGARILSPESVETFTARHRTGMKDETFRLVYDWGLGFMLTTRSPGIRQMSYDFGAHASLGAYGHGGSQSSHAFADPAHGLAAAWVCNGMPGEAIHRRRNHAINTAIYEDLGLTGAA